MSLLLVLGSIGTMTSINKSWFLPGTGFLALLVGALVYLIDRDPTLVPFFSSLSLYGVLPPLFGSLSLSLPTLTHVFAFSVLTYALFDSPRVNPLGVCVSWLGIDLAFEIVQHPVLAVGLAGAIDAGPGWLSMLEPVRHYAIQGTFDPLDLLSIVFGACLACGFLYAATEDSDEH